MPLNFYDLDSLRFYLRLLTSTNSPGWELHL